MNLISNCCLNSFLLRMYGYGNTNPFTWVEVDFNSFLNLLNYYDTINWNNFELSRRAHPYPCFKGRYVYEITVDNKIKISYVHYFFDPNIKELQIAKNGKDIYYCKIWEFIVEKYLKRTKTMLDNKIDPIFIIEWEAFGFFENEMKKFLEIPSLKYKVIIITNNKEFAKVKKKNLFMIYDENTKDDNFHKGLYPGNFAEKYASKIKEIINQ